MKKIFITLLLHFFFVMPSFSLGSIITTRNSYFYAKPNLQSTQYYISTYNSFKVLDIFVDSRGKVFFLVEKNIIRKKKKRYRVCLCQFRRYKGRQSKIF